MKTWHWLLAIFLLTAGIRIFIAVSVPYFSSDEAYFVLRQIDEIRETGTPLYHDPLSYGGRVNFFLPLFHYVVAFFSLFMGPVMAAKIAPNLLASTLVIPVYLIVHNLTKSSRAALFCAFVSGFIPVYVKGTLNTVSVHSLTLPAAFFLIYFLLRLRTKYAIYYYLVTLCLFIMLSPYSLLIVLAMVLFILLSWVEGFRPTRSEIELTLFSLFLTSWVYLLVFRDALLVHGTGILLQNIPAEVMNQFFSDINIAATISEIGVIPLLAGSLVLYYYLFRKQKKAVYLLFSLTLIIVMLMLFKSIQLAIGLMFIGAIFTILLGELLVEVIGYIEKTRLARFQKPMMAAILILFVLTSVVPSIAVAMQSAARSDSKDKVLALTLLADVTSGDAAVAGSVFDGHLISYTSRRKNIIDSNFLMIDSSERLRDIRTIYTSAVQSKALEIMNKYDAEYLILTQESKQYYNITRIPYAEDECFPLFYGGNDVRIYENKCRKKS